MSFTIRSFDFRAMAAANNGASIEKLNGIIDAQIAASRCYQELLLEERALEESITTTCSGRDLSRNMLSREQLEEINGYLREADDHLAEIIEQRDAAKKEYRKHTDDMHRMANVLDVELEYAATADLRLPVCEHVLDSNEQAEIHQEQSDDSDSNENIHDRVVRYNVAICNGAEPDQALLLSIYQMADEEGLRIVSNNRLIQIARNN